MISNSPPNSHQHHSSLSAGETEGGSVGATSTVTHFAWTVAGPRDFAINLVLNAGIAWWLFRSTATLPLVGTPSVAGYILPMSFILATVTTYFGYLNGVGGRKAGVLSPPLDQDAGWRARAIGSGLLRGLLSFAVTVTAVLLCHRLAPAAAFPTGVAVGGIGLLAGCMGYVLHAQAVVRSARIQ